MTNIIGTKPNQTQKGFEDLSPDSLSHARRRSCHCVAQTCEYQPHNRYVGSRYIAPAELLYHLYGIVPMIE